MVFQSSKIGRLCEYQRQSIIIFSKLIISKRKTDIDSSRSWRLACGKPVRLQNFMTTQELKKNNFGFIKAKDGPATKTDLDMTKAIYIIMSEIIR